MPSVEETETHFQNIIQEARDRPSVQGDPVHVASTTVYDWEGYEIDDKTGKRIGPGYSQSKKYKQFLNETRTDSSLQDDLKNWNDDDWDLLNVGGKTVLQRKKKVQENYNHNMQEKDLCPICKNGQQCCDLVSHASKWDTGTKESIDWKKVPREGKITKGGGGYEYDGQTITWSGIDAADANYNLHKRATQETEAHFQRIIQEGHNQYLNSASEVKETMDNPKRLCECKDIKETESYLTTHKATKAQRHLVGLAVRMTDADEKKKAFEFVENDIKETEGSHQSDGDGLPSIPSVTPTQNAHAMSGVSQMKEQEFDMTTCVSNAIANGASPEQARATCSQKQGVTEMVREAMKPWTTAIKEIQTEFPKFKEAVTALDNKIQETNKSASKSRTLEFIKSDGPGGAIRETQPTVQPNRIKSQLELMDTRREICHENDRLQDQGGALYQ